MRLKHPPHLEKRRAPPNDPLQHPRQVHGLLPHERPARLRDDRPGGPLPRVTAAQEPVWGEVARRARRKDVFIRAHATK